MKNLSITGLTFLLLFIPVSAEAQEEPTPEPQGRIQVNLPGVSTQISLCEVLPLLCPRSNPPPDNSPPSNGGGQGGGSNGGGGGNGQGSRQGNGGSSNREVPPQFDNQGNRIPDLPNVGV